MFGAFHFLNGEMEVPPHNDFTPSTSMLPLQYYMGNVCDDFHLPCADVSGLVAQVSDSGTSSGFGKDISDKEWLAAVWLKPAVLLHGLEHGYVVMMAGVIGDARHDCMFLCYLISCHFCRSGRCIFSKGCTGQLSQLLGRVTGRRCISA